MHCSRLVKNNRIFAEVIRFVRFGAPGIAGGPICAEAACTPSKAGSNQQKSERIGWRIQNLQLMAPTRPPLLSNWAILIKMYRFFGTGL